MKKNNKVNPLTHFNNLKAAAVKKAGGEMSTYKKSLRKAQDGRVIGPLTEKQTSKLDKIFGPNTPMISSPETIDYYKDVRDAQEEYMRERSLDWTNDYPGKVRYGERKKGGSVKRKRK